MADDEKIAEFVSVTGADQHTATFFLRAAADDVAGAITAYFDSGGMEIPPPSAEEASASSDTPAVASSSSAPVPTRAQPARGGFATLATIGKPDSDDDESGKNYYAGGEKSGQMIQDPRGRRRERNGHTGNLRHDDQPEPPADTDGDDEKDDVMEAIFERARERGPLSDAERAEFSDRQRFTGAGYRLGASESASSGTAMPDIVGKRNVMRTLTFYANGFTIDDGPLRAYDDPANAAFLGEINRGFVPKEMEEPGLGDVSINLVDKKDTNYEPPKAKLVPFSGGGNRLGSSAGPSSSAAASTASDESTAAATINVDESRPVATIQVRLSDGTRLSVRLNEDHTVQHLRNYVAASRPGLPSFNLATAFPRVQLTNLSQTIKDAKLNGAVVVQTLS